MKDDETIKQLLALQRSTQLAHFVNAQTIFNDYISKIRNRIDISIEDSTGILESKEKIGRKKKTNAEEKIENNIPCEVVASRKEIQNVLAIVIIPQFHSTFLRFC